MNMQVQKVKLKLVYDFSPTKSYHVKYILLVFTETV